jgi:hypothetical protein
MRIHIIVEPLGIVISCSSSTVQKQLRLCVKLLHIP